MTPLATKVANQLATPAARRQFDDRGKVLGLIGQDLHCFEITAIAKHINDVMEAENIWPEVESMAPRMFLPSPVTWLEIAIPGEDYRLAWVLEEQGESFRLSLVGEGPHAPYSLPVCIFRARALLEMGDRIDTTSLVKEALGDDDKEKPSSLIDSIIKGGPDTVTTLEAKAKMARLELARLEREKEFLGGVISAEHWINHGIAFCVLALDLINTPGLVGLRQHDPHRGLAKRLAAYRSGSYPLRGWSEIVLKHQTRIAEEAEHHTGATFHKCLHFVRSHLRHYRNGRVTVIPAHWRGDPALGIKRTRYRLAA